MNLDAMEPNSPTEQPILDLLYQLVRSQDRRVTGPILELGIYQGHASESLVRAKDERRYIGVDRNRAHCKFVSDRLSLLNCTDWAIVDSDAIAYLENYDDEPLGFVFIDDCHETEHVERELALLKRLCQPFALITGHDTTNYPGIAKAFRNAGGQALMVGERGLGIIQV